jgi:folate-dependent phosphoribosylglycinamide formyltransferase PurN
MQASQIALLTRDADFGRISAHYLADRFAALSIVVEHPASRAGLLRRRVRRLGLTTVAGQIGFMLAQRVQERAARGRIDEINHKLGLVDAWPQASTIEHVASVNAPECVALLKRTQPAAVLVVGTRLIDKAVLESIDAPFINYHAGITPKYRGVHGGYWALARGDAAHCGVTVHLVDAGIDTGAVLYQQSVTPAARDNFSTLPYLQLAAALPLLERAARDALASTLAPRQVDLPSGLWSHPTLWGYLATGWRSGVW